MFLSFKLFSRNKRRRFVSIASRLRLVSQLSFACLINLCWVNLCLATDFQMPSTVQLQSAEGVESKTSFISKGTYKTLTHIQKDIDLGNTNAAFNGLNKLILRVHENVYETAVVLKTAGYIYVDLDKTDKAIELLTLALSRNALAHENQQKLRFDLAQLFLNKGDEQSTKRYLTAWRDNAQLNELTTSMLIKLGNTYSVLKDYRQASGFFEQAISKNEAPVEYHYQLLLASYALQDEYKKAIKLLKNIITLFPDNQRYPFQLTALYDAVNNKSAALSAMEFAYKRGFFTETQQYSDLAYRLLDLGYPYKSIEVLEQGFSSFLLWVTPENLMLLAQAHIDAKQNKQAIPVLEKALASMKNTHPANVLSQLYLENEDYLNAERVLKIALATQDKEQAIHIKLSLAHVLYKLEKYNSALTLFDELKQLESLDNATNQLVDNWYAYLSKINQAS